MKRFGVVSGICISFLLGMALTAVAQDDHPSERPPNAPQEPRDNRGDQGRGQDQMHPQNNGQPQDQARPDDRHNQQPESGNRRDTTPQSEDRQRTGQQDQQSGDRHMQGRDTYDNGRSNQGRPEDRSQEDRAPAEARGREGHPEQERIPDQDFRAHYGREHRFRPGRMQVYEGHPRFSYGGHTFELAQAWPGDWSYDDDDCYVDYVDGGYWMFDERHPGMRVALILIG